MDLDLNNWMSSKNIRLITNVSFLIGELLFVATERKLILTSIASLLENLENSKNTKMGLLNVY